MAGKSWIEVTRESPEICEENFVSGQSNSIDGSGSQVSSSGDVFRPRRKRRQQVPPSARRAQKVSSRVEWESQRKQKLVKEDIGRRNGIISTMKSNESNSRCRVVSSEKTLCSADESRDISESGRRRSSSFDSEIGGRKRSIMSDHSSSRFNKSREEGQHSPSPSERLTDDTDDNTDDERHMLETEGNSLWTHHERESFDGDTAMDSDDDIPIVVPNASCRRTSNSLVASNDEQKKNNSSIDGNHSFPESMNLLSLYAINRRLVARQRRISSTAQRTRLTALSGCLYHIPPSVPGPPGAIPEHTPVWAQVSDDMPAQSPIVREKTYPWHLARVIYCRPAPGFCLGYIHQNGEAENIQDYLVEWTAPNSLRIATPLTPATPTPPITRNQGLPLTDKRSSSRQMNSSDLQQPRRRMSGGKDGSRNNQKLSDLSGSPILSASQQTSSPVVDATAEEDVKQESLPSLSPLIDLNVMNSFPLIPEQLPISHQSDSSQTPPPLSHVKNDMSPLSCGEPPTKKRKSSADHLRLFSNTFRLHSEVDIGPPYLACAPWHYEYYVHYHGFNRRYDRWCSLGQLLPITLDPKTLELSPKAVARQILSALHGIGHPQVCSKSTKEDSLSTTSCKPGSRMKNQSNDVANALTLSIIRTLCSLFIDWNNKEGNEDSDKQNQGEIPNRHSRRLDISVESDDVSECRIETPQIGAKLKPRTPHRLLSWCLSFLDKSVRHEDTGKRKKKKSVTPVLGSVADLSKLWWTHVVFSHFQMDIVEIQAALYSSAKKKRKYGNLNHPSAGPNIALLASCPSPHVLKALEGRSGISIKCLNDRDTSMLTKWKNLKSLDPTLPISSSDILHPSTSESLSMTQSTLSSTLPSPTDADSSVVDVPRDVTSKVGRADEITKEYTPLPFSRPPSTSGVKVFKFDASKHPMQELTSRLCAQMQKVLTLIIDLANERPQRPRSDSDDLKLESASLAQNSSGADCFDTVESDAGEHEGLDKGSIEAHESATKLRTITTIQINQYVVPTWYYSPFPLAVQPTECLFICAGCLEFFKKEAELNHHELLCAQFTPPGDEIYRDGQRSFFEVDGEVEWAYCENLSLMAKLFLDHKTLQYSVTPFLFYVLVEWDDTPASNDNQTTQSALLRNAGLTPARNNQIVGYFSKEKQSSMGYNLACILTLPQHQRKGYGKYFIHFSYALSKIEQKSGTPERPLSDLGRVSYNQYWKLILTECLLSPTESPPACTCLFSEVPDSLSAGLCKPSCRYFNPDDYCTPRHENDYPRLMGELGLSVDDLAHFTSMRKEDISATLEAMGVLRRDLETGEYVMFFDRDALIDVRRRCGRPPPSVLPENFVWAPISTGPIPVPSSAGVSPSNEALSVVPPYNHEAVQAPRKQFHFPYLDQCPHHW